MPAHLRLVRFYAYELCLAEFLLDTWETVLKQFIGKVRDLGFKSFDL